MKTKSTFLGLIILSVLCTSCDHETIRASNSVTTNEIQLSDYSGLRLSNAFNAYITFSNTEEKIEIEANDNLHKKIIVRKEGENLIVKLQNHTTIQGNATLNVYITTTKINSFDISGASSVYLENVLDAQDVAIELSGASNFTGDIFATTLDLNNSGASKATVFGAIDNLDASLSGSSTFGSYELVIKQLAVNLSGSSDASLTVNESIAIDATGASTLKYKGAAVVTHKELSGASQIIKND